jgi:hypothetical protein
VGGLQVHRSCCWQALIRLIQLVVALFLLFLQLLLILLLYPIPLFAALLWLV